MRPDNKVSLEFSVEELEFLYWAMCFLEGGPFDKEEEVQRDKTEFKIRKALTDIDKGIIHTVASGLIYITCAFCGGDGAFPDILPIDIEPEPCPVCKGRGLNAFETNPENAIKCKFCGGEGKACNSSGIATGDVCQVCHGTGIVLLEEVGEISKNNFLWDLIHPAITRVSKGRFETGHYADSVEAAFKEINKVVKEIVKTNTGEEIDGAALMNKAFSQNRPVIRIGDLSTETGRNIQMGYMQIFAGAMIGIRNPKAHENLETDVSTAIHHLTLASLLMFKLDERS